jgi:hypothetical protein
MVEPKGAPFIASSKPNKAKRKQLFFASVRKMCLFRLFSHQTPEANARAENSDAKRNWTEKSWKQEANQWKNRDLFEKHSQNKITNRKW